MFVHVHLCVRGGVIVCVHICTCIWRPEDNALHLFFDTHFSLNLELFDTVQLDCLISHP